MLINQVADLQNQLRWIVAAMIVSDEPTAAAAGAYEGLRSAVVMAAGDRRRLLVTLASLCDAIEKGQGINEISSKIEEEMERNGLTRTSDFSDPDYFDFLNEPMPNCAPRVVSPAFVDRESRTLIRPGIAEYITGAGTSPETHPEDATQQLPQEAREPENLDTRADQADSLNPPEEQIPINPQAPTDEQSTPSDKPSVEMESES